MAKEYKVLGQAAPAADTDTALYTAPAQKQFVTGHLSVVNRSATDALKVRIAVVPTGEVLANKHWIEYDVFVAPNGKVRLAEGSVGAAGTVVWVRANSANASFSLFGVEGA